jgi:hypothetical protein
MSSRTTRATSAAVAGSDANTIVLNTQLPKSAQSTQGTQKTPTASEITRLKALLEERQLQNELAKIDHDAQMRVHELAEAAAKAATAAAVGAGPSSPGTIYGDDFYSGEQFTPQVLNTTTQFPGVQAKDVSLILYGKFDPFSLPKLRAAIGSNDDDLQHLTRLDNTTGRLMITRTRGNLKDFGDTPAIWTESFVIYIRIVSALFSQDHPLAVPAMLHFLSRVLQWATSHEWHAVLRLATAWHHNVMSTSQLAPESWRVVPLEWVDMYLTNTTLASRAIKRVKSDALLKVASAPNTERSPNSPEVTCHKWNTLDSCNVDWCKRAHICSRCKSTDHPAHKCRS